MLKNKLSHFKPIIKFYSSLQKNFCPTKLQKHSKLFFQFLNPQKSMMTNMIQNLALPFQHYPSHQIFL